MRRALNFPSGGGHSHSGSSPQPDIHPNRLEMRGMDNHSGTRPRARFVQDGDVPVTIVNRAKATLDVVPSSSRLSQAEAALATERTARLRAERALSEAQIAIRDLRTKQAHADLALHEAAETARVTSEAARAELERALAALSQDLETERAARIAAELALQKALAAHERALQEKPARADPVKHEADAATELFPDTPVVRKPRAVKAASAVKKPRKVAVPKVREPKPVKWWIK